MTWPSGAPGPSRLLVAGGSGLVLTCGTLAAMENLAAAPRTFLALFGLAFLSYAAGLLGLRALDDRRALVVTLAVAGAGRLALLPAAPTLSTDAYRYLWDARVASAGLDPYAYAPTAPEVAYLRDARIYPRLNHATWRTIYPPAAQAFFRAVYALKPDSVLALKLAIGLVELGGLAALVGLLRALDQPLWRLAIYAWSPLVLVEVWGSGHLDALAVTAVVSAVLAAVQGRHVLAAVVLALGTLLKLYPAALLPLLLRAGGGRVLIAFGLVLGLGYAPIASRGLEAFGSLPRYLTEEYFNPGLIRTLLESPAVTLLGLGAWVGWITSRREPASLPERAVPLLGGAVLLSPNVFPWYVLWLVPFLAVTPSLPWIAFTGTVAFAYAFFLYDPWTIPIWARLVEVAPLALGAAWWLGGWLGSSLAVGRNRRIDKAVTSDPP